MLTANFASPNESLPAYIVSAVAILRRLPDPITRLTYA